MPGWNGRSSAARPIRSAWRVFPPGFADAIWWWFRRSWCSIRLKNPDFRNQIFRYHLIFQMPGQRIGFPRPLPPCSVAPMGAAPPRERGPSRPYKGLSVLFKRKNFLYPRIFFFFKPGFFCFPHVSHLWRWTGKVQNIHIFLLSQFWCLVHQ